MKRDAEWNLFAEVDFHFGKLLTACQKDKLDVVFGVLLSALKSEIKGCVKEDRDTQRQRNIKQENEQMHLYADDLISTGVKHVCYRRLKLIQNLTLILIMQEKSEYGFLNVQSAEVGI